VSVAEYVAYSWPGLLLVAAVLVGVPMVLIERRER
jgi:hypothetical protein